MAHALVALLHLWRWNQRRDESVERLVQRPYCRRCGGRQRWRQRVASDGLGVPGPARLVGIGREAVLGRHKLCALSAFAPGRLLFGASGEIKSAKGGLFAD